MGQQDHNFPGPSVWATVNPWKGSKTIIRQVLRTIYPGVLGSFCQALSEHNQLHHVQQSGPVQLLAGVVRASIIGGLILYSFATLCIPLPPLVIRTCIRM